MKCFCTQGVNEENKNSTEKKNINKNFCCMCLSIRRYIEKYIFILINYVAKICCQNIMLLFSFISKKVVTFLQNLISHHRHHLSKVMSTAFSILIIKSLKFNQMCFDAE